MRLPLLLPLLSLLLVAGCDEPPPDTDAGPRVDAGPDDTDAGSDETDAGPDDSDAGPPGDAGPPMDAGPPPDAGPPADGGPGGGCGTSRPDLSGITGSEGLVIARDGTIYYSQSGGMVGRLTPGGSPENGWANVGGAGAVAGMVLDAANAALFVAVPGTGLVEVDTGSAAISGTRHTGGDLRGVTLADNGRVYFTDSSGNAVHFYDPGAGGASVEVTASPIPGATGLVFTAADTVLVGSDTDGNIVELMLGSDGTEMSRTGFSAAVDNPDGMALDADGNIFVSDQRGGASAGRLYEFSSGGTRSGIALMNLTSPASVEFGVGALNCMDIYVATGGAVERYEHDTNGAAVPWH